MTGVLSGCTTTGMHLPDRRGQIDYGTRVPLRVCLLRDAEISEQRARALIAVVDQEFDPYGIDVAIVWIRPWQRPGFTMSAIMRDLAPRPLEPPCDRLVAMVGRHLGDMLWGLALPEVLGAVETTTHTRGYVVSSLGSLNQILSSPSGTAVHEFYHLLGCTHALSKSACYEQIRTLKRHYSSGIDFFPGLAETGQPILSRAESDALLSLQTIQ